MKVIGSIGDVNGDSSLECYRLVDSFIAEKPDRFQSARMILCSLGLDETEPSQELKVLLEGEPKWQ